MRLAVLADIHGNLPAFEAALAHARQQGYDQMVLLGDMVVCAPDSADCWHLARSLGVPMLRGNHERYVAHYGTDQGSPLWKSAQFSPVQWAVSQLSDSDRLALGQLPTHLRLAGFDDLLLVHAGLRTDRDSVWAHTPESELEAIFAGANQRWLVRGHNHVGQTRLWNRRVIVSAGSVGLPLDGTPSAQYLMVEHEGKGYRTVQHAVPYNLDAAVERFHSTGYLRETGAMGRLLLRELVTASHYLTPFLRWYQGKSGGEGSRDELEKAVERFLKAF